jgi:hypothetical protein
MMARSESDLQEPWVFPALRAVALYGFAFVQPVFELVSRRFMTMSRGLEQYDLLVLIAGLSVVAPALIVSSYAVASGLGRRWSHALHGLVIVVFTSVTFLPLANAWIESGWVVQIVSPIATGALALFLHGRYAWFRTFLTILSPAPVLFAAVFLATSPALELTFPPRLELGDADLAAPDRPTIYFVVFDEVSGTSLMSSDGDIDEDLFPNFARLAEQSTWYRKASTVATYTNVAIPAILKGRYPQTKAAGAPYYDYADNLFTLLAPSYRMKVTELTQACHPALCAVESGTLLRRLGKMGRSVAGYLVLANVPRELWPRLHAWLYAWRTRSATAHQGTEGNRSVAESLEAHSRALGKHRAFERFIDDLETTQEPTLHYLHTLLTHSPHFLLPTGQTYESHLARSASPADLWKTGWPTASLAQRGYQRYLLQLVSTDALLGRLMDRLKGLRMFDSSIIVVMADHGTSFRPERSLKDIDPALADNLSVPLFIKAPFQAVGRVEDRNVETIDILPTLAELVGLDVPFPLDGKSLVGADSAERAHKRVTVIDDPWESGVEEYVLVDGDFEALAESIQWKEDIFGFETGLQGLWSWGLFGDLVGKPVSELDVVDAPSGSVRIEAHDDFYARVDPGASWIPALVKGRVDGIDESAGLSGLAVAVNDEVQAVVALDVQGTPAGDFYAVVPPDSFRKGPNTVRVFGIVRRNGGIELSRFPRSED